ncbi:MAG: FAD-binding protein [Verrucomicrobia bacterium]|nr:FAD-binding protein [Verrucomicrobiota bacterium]
MAIDARALAALRHLLGRERCRTDPETLTCYGYDATRQQAMPDVVLTPRTAEEISGIMKLAYEHGIPVCPRGAGSGLTGGAVPVSGGIVLDCCSMNRILEIDPPSSIAWVEPGVVLQDFQRAVEALGLFYPPDPASSDMCTIGGNVAECAGGLRCVKYGVTRDYVLALEVVLPTGEIIHTGSTAMKSVTGYDLTRLLVGSEGTLGIFTRIALRLIPKPEAVETVLATFPRLEAAVEAGNSILGAGIVPRGIELIDKHCLRAVHAYSPSDELPTAGAVLLIEVDGPADSLTKPRERIVDLCRAVGAERVTWSADPEEREGLWALRRAISPALYSICARRINEDIAVPRSRLLETLRRIDEIGARHGLTIAKFGHVGDGNIHANILLEDTRPETNRRAQEAVETIFRTVIELGGTLSGEHGIGNTKSAYLHLECGPVEIDLMRRLKRLFDPKGLLNPGKVFPPEAG